jgi:hypothetical protein
MSKGRTSAPPFRAGDFRRRGRLHVTCAVSGLFASAAWSAAVLGVEGAHADRAGWYSLINLIGFSAVIALGLALQRVQTRRLALDRACTGLVIALLVVWERAAGGASTWLLGLPPVLILAHWVSGGAPVGVVAWVTATIVEVGLLAVGARFGAPAPDGSEAAMVGRTAWLSSVGFVATCAAAAWLGRELTKPRLHVRVNASASGVASKSRPSSGDVIDGKYRLLRRLGKGGMGQVYEAERAADGTRVALKILHPHLAELKEPLARFRREIEIAQRLPADRIARVLDFGTAGRGIEYIAMELLRGEDLAARLHRVKRLGLNETLALSTQLADTLDAAAENGIVHRDVKPRNVFLVERGDGQLEARLLDFGISRLQDGALGSGVTHSAAILGTPGYLAPEQVASTFGTVGPHTDVFALGCVVYRALSGQNAFPARDPASAVYEVLNHDPPPIRELSPELPQAVEWVLALALAKHPSDRYARAGELARDLKAAAAGTLPSSVSERARLLLAARRGPVGTLAT